jgi:ribosome biogenesis GTPase A
MQTEREIPDIPRKKNYFNGFFGIMLMFDHRRRHRTQTRLEKTGSNRLWATEEPILQTIHWYPGHMAKAKRQLTDLIQYLDIIIEIRDARLPLISHNQDLEPLLKKRPNLVLLNKTDLADPEVTGRWSDWFAGKGVSVVQVNGRNGQGVQAIWPKLTQQFAGKQTPRALRIGVVGIPNVGKSSILNRITGSGSAKTGNLPGVTRGKQWIKKNGFEILDMPGLLPPKINNQEDGIKLALIGTIREEIIPTYDLALVLLENYGEQLFGWSKEGIAFEHVEEKLQWYAKKRGFLLKGGAIDLNRGASALLNDFRNGQLGRISLELPPLDSGAESSSIAPAPR